MRPLPLVPCLFFFASAIAPQARADDYCVHDSTGLKQAIDRATLDWTGDSTIRLRQGTYVTSGVYGANPNNPINNDLAILGGYTDPDCGEAGRSLDPATTILRAAVPGGQDGFYFNMDGDLLLKSLTFRGYGRGVLIASPDPAFGTDDQWTLDRIRIEGSGGADASANTALYIITQGDADISLQQVVVANNPDNENGCAAILYPDDNAVVVKQSAFAYNTGNALCIRTFGNDPPTDIDNNIFWGNGLGLSVTGVPSSRLHVRHNTIDGNVFQHPPSINVGNNSLDPQFLDAPGRDYRLFASSPAVDAGINPPTGGLPGSDIAGGPRVIGANVDRGPWETDVSSATTLMVTTTAASGVGSLAAAIQQSNDLPGVQVIRFNIAGACPRIINQVSGQPLPEITDSVRIEGYSQPGSVRGAPPERTLCVGVTANGQMSKVLSVALGAPVSLDVSGLGLGGTTLTSGAATLTLLAGSGHQISGNQFGGEIGPIGNRVALGALQTGLLAGFAAHDSTIGGFDPEQGNVFNGASGAAIDLGSTTTTPANFRIFDNYVGLAPAGTAAAGNGTGIVVHASSGNWLANNWIGGNSGDGLRLEGNSDGNFILANDIGRCAACLHFPGHAESLVGNGLHGVLLQVGADGNVLNGNRIAGNAFGYAEEHGANGNALVYNAIYRNTGLGIDIGRDGVTPNDSGGPSLDGVQNYPVLASAGGGFYAGSVHGALSSPAERTYAIEIYASDACDASGFGEGQRLVGRGSVTTPPSPLPGIHSSASFDIAIESGGLDGKAITAIARSEGGSTSEFSACKTYVYSDVIFADGFDGTST